MPNNNPFIARVFNNTVYLLFGIVASNLSLFACNIILARIFSKQDYGIFMTVQCTLGVFLLITGLGITEGSTKLISEYIGKNDLKSAQRAVNGSLKLLLFCSLCFSIIQFFCARLISDNFSSIDITFLLKLTALWNIPYYIIVWGASIIEGMQKMQYSSIVRYLFEPLKLLILLILILFCVLSIRNVYIAWTILYWILAACIALFLKFFLIEENISLYPSFDKSEVPILKSSFPFFIPLIAPPLIYMLLPLMIGTLRSVTDVADFTAVLPFSSLSALLLMPLSISLLPAISENFHKNRELIENSCKNLFKLIGLLNICIFFFIGYGGKLLIVLFIGEKYISSVYILYLLLIAVYFENYKFVVDPLLKGSGHVNTISILAYVRLILLFLVGYFSIVYFGAQGAALTLCLINFPVLLIKIWFLGSCMKIKLWRTFLKELSLIIFTGVCLFFNIHWVVTLLSLCAIIILIKIVTINELYSWRAIIKNRAF